MGNKGSTEYGGIFVQTSKPQYFPGEIITGTISLHITKLGFPARQLKVVVTGKEILHGTFDIDSDSESETNYNTNTSVQILKNEKTIYKFQLAIVPLGQFTTQFSFQLPQNIPGTFNNNHLCGGFERIIYKVKAILIASKGYKNMTHIQQFQVREPIYQPEQQVITDGKIKDGGYCFRKQGSAYITAVADRNAYRIGEAIRILLEINDDESDVKAEKIILQLENTSEFFYNNKVEKTKTILQEVEINSRLQRLGSYKVLNSQEVILFVSHQNHNNNDQYNQIQPSTNGQLIKSQYCITITAKFGITCLSSEQYLELPIQVLASTQLVQNKVSQPDHWNPLNLNDEILQQLSNNKQSCTSLHSFSTHHRSGVDRNSVDFQQESQQSIRFRNSQRLNQSLNQQMM